MLDGLQNDFPTVPHLILMTSHGQTLDKTLESHLRILRVFDLGMWHWMLSP